MPAVADVKGPKAAERGNPSFVWRAGQQRRFDMLEAAAPLAGKVAVDAGCGIGTYLREIGRRTPQAFGFDVELERLADGLRAGVPGMVAAVGERLPYADNSVDVILSNEVIEHVDDDRLSAREMIRVLRPGGRAVLFAPNRLYFFETHGVYWRGEYRFGNKPFVNWLPSALRNRLAPHVRAYTARGLRALFDGAPCRVVRHIQIYGGFDNVVRRMGVLGRLVRGFWQALEATPLRVFGISHLLVVEKTAGSGMPQL